MFCQNQSVMSRSEPGNPKCITGSKRSDLSFLTLLPYKEVFPYRGLIKTTGAACFECYEEQSEIGGVYDALIWQIEPITICSKHGHRLQTTCLYKDCGMPLRFIGPRHHLGYCSYCLRWLGTNLLPSHPPLTSTEKEEQTYIVSAVGELLATAPALELRPNRNNISGIIRRGVNELFDGNGKAFATALGLHHKTLYELRDGTQLPQIGTLLKLCRLLGTTPLKLLTNGAVWCGGKSHGDRPFLKC